MSELTVRYVRLDELEHDPANPKDHDLGAIHTSFSRFGYVEPVVRDERTGRLVAGHGRTVALAQSMADGDDPPEGVRTDEDGVWMVPVVHGWSSRSDEDARAALVALNRTTELGGWHPQQLADLLADLAEAEAGLEGTGYDGDDLDRLLADLADADDTVPLGDHAGALRREFGAPPFTLLDARQGYWKARKREWLQLGLRGEEGRSDEGMDARPDHGSSVRPGADGDLVYDEQPTRASVFDPVLTELVYRWYCPPDGTVLDPFAGGSTRGIVAGVLGYGYDGVDLRPEQVTANRDQAVELSGALLTDPSWHVGDARELLEVRKVTDRAPYDLVLTCPPYYDLERYGDDERDLSAAPTPAAFHETLADCLTDAAALLAPNRFLAVVLGDARDRAGGLYALTSHLTVRLQHAGLALYNDAVYVTPYGSLPVRAGGPFRASRKLGRCHQHVLVYWNGDPAEVADHTTWEVTTPGLEDADHA